MNDPTESIRRQRLAEINAEPGSREALESQYGQVWVSPGESKPATQGRNAAAGGCVEESPPDLRYDHYELQGADAPSLPGSSSFFSRLGFFDPGGEMAGFDSSSGDGGVSGGVIGPAWFRSR